MPLSNARYYACISLNRTPGNAGKLTVNPLWIISALPGVTKASLLVCAHTQEAVFAWSKCQQTHTQHLLEEGTDCFKHVACVPGVGVKVVGFLLLILKHKEICQFAGQSYSAANDRRGSCNRYSRIWTSTAKSSWLQSCVHERCLQSTWCALKHTCQYLQRPYFKLQCLLHTYLH